MVLCLISRCEYESTHPPHAGLNWRLIETRMLRSTYFPISLGLGQSKGVTPIETAIAVFTSSGSCGVVDGKRVVETEQGRKPQPHPHRSRASG